MFAKGQHQYILTGDELDRIHGRHRYWTNPLLTDDEAGNATLQLCREIDGQTTIAAAVVYWDAEGQYYLDTFSGEVPIVIIEELLSEAKEKIKTK